MCWLSCVLFDLDGTLIDSNELIIESFKHTFKLHLGRNIPETEIARTFGRPLVEVLHEYAGGDGNKAGDMLATYQKHNESQHDTAVGLFPGVKETLARLKLAGCTLAAVTGKRRRLALRGLRLCGLDEYMAVVVTPEDTEWHKPKPDPVLKALTLLQQPAQNTLMVGDSPSDLASARAAGTYTAAVSWSVVPVEYLRAQRPDFVLQSMADLLTICRFKQQVAREQ
ncbi:MAG TPA: pyrophosphatase PpaX [bacterium]|nr:pyrophosphatase PpaX [bacterium]